jgi:hypothetical protein
MNNGKAESRRAFCVTYLQAATEDWGAPTTKSGNEDTGMVWQKHNKYKKTVLCLFNVEVLAAY